VCNRQRVGASNDGNNEQHPNDQELGADPDAQSPPRSQDPGQQHPSGGQNGVSPRSYQKSASISASKCVVVNPNKQREVLTNAVVPEFSIDYCNQARHILAL
jgi:hypothetical protein